MNPGAFVAGGGGDGGGKGGKGGKGGNGNEGAGTGEGDEDASGDGNGSDACGSGSSSCPGSHGGDGTTAGDPVELASGAVFTDPVLELRLPGPLELTLTRQYNTKWRDRDIGLGFGWRHSLAFEVEFDRANGVLHKAFGAAIRFKRRGLGEVVSLGADRYLVEEEWGIRFVQDGLTYYFSAAKAPARYLLSSVADPHGNCIHLAYDKDKLVLIEDAVGRHIKPRYGADGRIRCFEVKNAEDSGRWITFRSYSYDPDGNLSAAADAEGFLVSYWYKRHLLIQTQQPGGLRAHFKYDRQDRCIETWCDRVTGQDPALDDQVSDKLADGSPALGIFHYKLDYLDDTTCELVTSREVRRIENGAHGGVEFGTTGGAVHTHERDDHGYEVCYQDPDGARWETARDSTHRVKRTTNPLGATTEMEYSTAGRLSRLTGPLGHWTDFDYDSVGSCTSIKDEVGRLLEITRDSRGQITSFVFPNGGLARVTYDRFGNRSSVEEPNGDLKRTRYDYLGRAVEFTDALGGVTRYHYDRRGLLFRVELPGGGTTELGYDAQACLASHTDPSGKRHRFSYGANDVLCRVHRPDGTSLRYGFDREVSLVSVQREGGFEWRYERDGSGLIVAEVTPDGRRIRFRHDACGRVIEELRHSGARTTFTYDAAGRLLSREYSDDTQDDFEYDAAGHLVRSTTSAGVVCEFGYDSRGRRISEHVTANQRSFQVKREFDTGNEATRIEAPEGTVVVRRDAMGRPLHVQHDSGWWCGSEWAASGEEQERKLPGGYTLKTRFDPRGRRTTQELSSATHNLVRHWSWDAGDQLVGGFRNGTPFYVESDGLGQLKRAQIRGRDYEYDSTPDFELLPLGKAGQLAPGGRVLQFDETSYAYDLDGNVVSRTHQGSALALEWSARGQLMRCERPDGSAVSYEYDTFDRRLSERHVDALNRTTKERYFEWNYFKQTRIVSRELLDGAIQESEERFLFSDQSHEPIAVETNGEWTSLVADIQRRPEWQIPTNGAPTELEYGALGDSQNAAIPLSFGGQLADDSGLHYNLHRYYDPSTGRFLSPDPIAVEGGVNPYAFVENRFFTDIDPSGLANPSTTTITGGGGATGHSQGHHTAHGTTGNYGGGAGNLPAGFPQLGGTYTGPNQCGEVEALNNFFGGLDPENPAHRDAIRARAQEIQGITPTRDSTGNEIAACAYCTQRLARLSDVSGVNLFESLSRPANGGSPVRNLGAGNTALVQASGVPAAFPYTVVYPPGGGSPTVTPNGGTPIVFS